MNEIIKAKRIFDIFSSIVALLLLFPVLVTLAIWIKLDSHGPVLFLQPRAGLCGRPFKVFKFRTMVYRDAHSIDQHKEEVISTEHDPRITRAGRFMRAFSLDELPQLINILKGDMSVVGPRPVLMEQKEVVPPGYMKRFDVQPGLTGLAQVKGRRSLGWLQQLAYDAEYVENRSFLYDLVIILLTVKAVLLRSGVYGGEGVNWRAYYASLQGRPPQDKDVEEAKRKSNETTQLHDDYRSS